MEFTDDINVRADFATPAWDEGIPRCSFEGCRFYDGKRCQAMGFGPDAVCEPAVEVLVQIAGEAFRKDDS